jgi:hypothetical protein
MVLESSRYGRLHNRHLVRSVARRSVAYSPRSVRSGPVRFGLIRVHTGNVHAGYRLLSGSIALSASDSPVI